MDRQHRHDLKHDKFVDEIGALSSKARDNQRILIGAAVAFIAAGLIFYGWLFYRSNQEAKAQALLATAISTFDAPVGDTATPPAGSTAPKFKTEQEKLAAAEKQFQAIQSSFGGSDAADVANLYLARIAVNKGDTARGRELLQTFVAEQREHILSSTARFSLYQLRIDGGEAAEVASELEAELAKPEPELPGDSLLVLLARAYEVLGQPEKVTETWRRVTVEFPESPYAVDAQRRLGT